MTAICGGGTSGPKPLVAAVVDYSSGLIASILAARGLNWLIPVIPLAGLPPLVLSTFCSSDPPTIPTFTSAETNAVINLSFGSDFDSGVSKLKDLILHTLWYDACQCTSGALDVFPTITPPTGTPITLPPVPQTSVPCLVVGPHNNIVNAAASGGSVGVSDTWKGEPFSVYQLTVVNNITTAPGYAINVTWVYLKTNPLVSDATNVFSVPSGATVTMIFPFNPTLHDFQTTWTRGAGSGANSVDYTMNAYCGGGPGVAPQPCCPPDTATQASLDLILQMVTLIQRQAVPFAYVASTAHSGLSGAGSLSISGLLGIKVAVTTLPAQLGSQGTSPAEYFDMGWLTFGTLDGYPQSYRLERSAQILLPNLCSAFTSLDYDLHPGVVVTITELLREP